MIIDAKQFAREWIDAWNSHDLERIMAHYSDDFEIATPMIKMALGEDTGTLRGKERIREYWSAALQKIPTLRFELIDVAEGVNSVALYYHSVLGKKAIEIMFFNEEGKVNRVVAHYS